MRRFYGGSILTMNSAQPRVESINVEGEQIVLCGDLAATRAAAPLAEEVDLAGACLLPGFIDAHHHFSEGALLTSGVNLHWPAVETVGDILDRVGEQTRRTPAGEWILAEGYDERRLRERRAPTLDELDAVAPQHPVLLVQFSYHEVVVNTRAHAVLQLPLERADPPGGEIDLNRSGRPTGRMIENASAPFYMGAIRSHLERDESAYHDCLARYQQRLFRTGITRVYDPAVSPLMERMLRHAAERGSLHLPVLMMPSSAEGMFMPPRDRLGGARTGDSNGLLRTGPLKIFMDGGIRLALSMPFGTALRVGLAGLRRSLARRNFDSLRLAGMTPVHFDLASRCIRSGILFYSEDEARSLVNAAVQSGMSLAVHAEGNVAIDRSLRVLPPTRADRPAGVAPNRIEHFFLPDPDAIPRAAGMGIAAAVQPTIAEWTGGQLLDSGVIGRHLFVPLRSMLDAGMLLAGSSDAPVVDFDPLRGIRAAVQRKTEDGERLGDGQEITIREALEMYTVHAARSGGLEHETGTIETGKRADLVVLNADPTTLPTNQLERLSVQRTVCGGVDVYVAR
ncbi:MAG: amidohydrolase [Deltaproteobacteria bacterium]|nr:amidohydrolase [Deltaproteobacteria bacterium]